MTQPDTWYVAFGPDKTVKTDDGATGARRSTRTFKSEADAKLFAMQIVAKGLVGQRGDAKPASAQAGCRGCPDRPTKGFREHMKSWSAW